MNFDFGEVLTRAGQITWKHKILWLISALPALTGIFILPLLFGLFFLSEFDQYGQPRFVEEPLLLVPFFLGGIFVALLGFILTGIAGATVTFGVLRAEDGEEALSVRSLVEGAQKYWLRTLGIMFLTSVIFSFGYLILFGCLMLFGLLTLGLGFLCALPLIILLSPLMLVVYGFIEEALAAIVADDLGVIPAIERAWELVKANFWGILLLSFIVYFAISLLSGFISAPFMTPSSFMPFFTDGSMPDMRVIMLFIAGLTLLMFPLMLLVQGVGITFFKAAYAIAYLRLTRPKQADAPLISEANA